jgi:ring-1,2-phenylacetyl-CoA epoxidase subunit PaaD
VVIEVTAPPTEADVRAALASVPDPELPVVSIVDLGIVARVEVVDGRIEVDLLPTFIGCPALDAIEAAVTERLAGFGLPADIAFTRRVSWTSDRISAAGRERLAGVGIAPPADPSDVRCPWCESSRVVMDSVFGPTQCRSLFYCRDCRQPFEGLKPI